MERQRKSGSNSTGRQPSRAAQAARPQSRESGDLISEPAANDVLLGRGRGIQQHPGNQRFQALVDQNKQSYFDATSRHEKIHIAHQVVVAIRQMGRFLKYDDHREGWVVVPEATARQKVCQALQYRRRQGEAAAQMEAMASSSIPAPVNPAAVATAAGAPVNPSAAAAAAAASVAFAAASAQNQALHSLQIDPYAQLSQLYPHVAAAAAVAAATAAVSRANGTRANGAAEAKQGESPDSDYASLIRALSRGAHNGGNNGSA